MAPQVQRNMKCLKGHAGHLYQNKYTALSPLIDRQPPEPAQQAAAEPAALEAGTNAAADRAGQQGAELAAIEASGNADAQAPAAAPAAAPQQATEAVHQPAAAALTAADAAAQPAATAAPPDAPPAAAEAGVTLRQLEEQAAVCNEHHAECAVDLGQPQVCLLGINHHADLHGGSALRHDAPSALGLCACLLARG